MINKRLLASTLILLSLTTSSFAYNHSLEEDLRPVKINNQEMSQINLLTKKDETLVNVSSLAKSLGFTVNYNNGTLKIIDTKNNNYTMKLNDINVTKNNENHFFTVKPFINNGSFYVPFREVVHLFDYSISEVVSNNQKYINIDTTQKPNIDHSLTFDKSYNQKFGILTKTNSSHCGLTHDFKVLQNFETKEFFEINHDLYDEVHTIWTKDNKLIVAENDNFSILNPENNSFIKENIKYDNIDYDYSKNSIYYSFENKNYIYNLESNEISEDKDISNNSNKNFRYIYINNQSNAKLDVITFENTNFINAGVLSRELGLDVKWENSTATITDKNKNVVEVKLKDVNINKNNKNYLMYDTPFIKNDRIYVPLRFVSEIFGYSVDYDNTKKSINIDTTTNNKIISSESLKFEKLNDKYEFGYVYGIYPNQKGENVKHLKMFLKDLENKKYHKIGTSVTVPRISNDKIYYQTNDYKNMVFDLETFSNKEIK